MANLRTELEELERFYGEPIEAMVVGKLDAYPYRDKPLPDENIILSRDAGLSKVDREYDNGFGGADCHPLYAWTASRVFYVHEYDGATDIEWAPRTIVALEPQFGGQSPLMDEIDRIVAARHDERAKA
jgi:hypothetical protein